GKWVLLQVKPINPGQPARDHLVRLIKVKDDFAFVFGNPITRIEWEPDQQTPFELDLTQLVVRGNIIPATAGKTFEFLLVTGMDVSNLRQPDQDALIAFAQARNVAIYRAIERRGRDNTISYLFTLPY